MLDGIRKFFRKIWEKIRKFCLWVWGECKDVRTLIILAIVIVLAYSPVWLCLLLYKINGWGWCLAVAGAYGAFWAGPFTPFFPLCIATAIGIKELLFPKDKKDNDKDKKQ